MNKKFDVIIVGSGAAGVQAAVPLVKAGLQVAMLDGGVGPDETTDLPPAMTFDQLRTQSPQQWQLFLGTDLSAVAQIKGSHGSQMTTGNKAFIVKQTEQLPLKTNGLEIFQSLGQGGLSEAWGAVCDIFSDAELLLLGLPPLRFMRPFYQQVINEIGVAGKKTGFSLQPPIKADEQAEYMIKAARAHPSFWERHHLTVTTPLMAVLTRAKKKRQALHYTELEFWENQGQSIYKPRLTLKELQQSPNFFYFPEVLVETVTETATRTIVRARQLQARQAPLKFFGDYVILAAGGINSCRILLRSFKLYDVAIPFITKPHTLSSYLNLKFLTHRWKKAKTGLCQLVINHTQDGITAASSQFYSYKALLWYKLLPFIPLPAPLALRFLALLGSALLVSDNRFAYGMAEGNVMKLKKAGRKDVLHLHYEISDTVLKKIQQPLAKIHRGLQSMWIFPLKTMMLPHGSTAHYAGGIPITHRYSNHPLSSNQDGQLRQAERIYLADTSTWSYLPAKPLTLTIMANARRLGALLADRITSAQRAR